MLVIRTDRRGADGDMFYVLQRYERGTGDQIDEPR